MGKKSRKQTRKIRNMARPDTQILSKIELLGILCIIVAGIVLAVHWPALSARALSTDDDEYLVNNKLIQNPGWPSAESFITEVLRPSTVRGYYQPLSMISLMTDYAMGGREDNLKVFHQTSLALHVMNTVLIIVFLYLLLGQPWAAATAGLLFGVHPMTVEAIPWVGERKTLLAAFFVLLSLIFYVLYTRKPARKFYLASLAMYILALMSKPTSTPLPALMLLLDYWPVNRMNLRALLEKIPFFAIGVVSAVITFLSQRYTGGVALPQEYSLMGIPLIICHNIVFYLHNIIWPVNLSSHYPFPRPLALSNPAVLAGVIGTCMLIPALLISLRWTRALLAGWLFFLIAILPAMGIVGFTAVAAADKYAYLPLVGFLILFCRLLNKAWNKVYRIDRRAISQIGLVVILLFLFVSESFATRYYLFFWKDTELLYRRMLSLAPQDASLHYDLGVVLAGRGKINEGIFHYKKSIRLNPYDADVYYNLGNALARIGKLDEAVINYHAVLSLHSDDADAHCNLGFVLTEQGKTDEAVEEFREALRLNPDLTDARNELDQLLSKQGKPGTQ